MRISSLDRIYALAVSHTCF